VNRITPCVTKTKEGERIVKDSSRERPGMTSTRVLGRRRTAEKVSYGTGPDFINKILRGEAVEYEKLKAYPRFQ